MDSVFSSSEFLDAQVGRDCSACSLVEHASMCHPEAYLKRGSTADPGPRCDHLVLRPIDRCQC